MKKNLLLISCIILSLSLIGCASFLRRTPRQDHGAGALALPPYSGPKARIAVADFDVKAAKAVGAIGSGLREMLVTALINSNRFLVVERQALSADLIITAAVTEFEPQASGGRVGIGAGGGASSGALGGLLGTGLNKAHIVLEMRIVNASNSEAVAATHIQGQAADANGTIIGGKLGAGLSVYANTAMEKAIRVCIIEAVRYISQAVPESYYKYK
ncbi:MAG: CsgG/HfaB family protein [Candidatus Omnitrophota bacterium]|jgi:curli biogenesis system outer membrane secretion channel CsgG